MARIRHLHLFAGDLPWRPTVMPDATPELTMIRTDVVGAVGLLVRFPADFRRIAPGSYNAPEDFLVVEGQLVLNDVTYGPGDLTHVPARAPRRSMTSADGALVLAWFGGPLDWVRAPGLPESGEPARSVATGTAALGVLLETLDATWTLSAGDGVDLGPDDDAVALPAGPWGRAGEFTAPGGARVLVRSPRPVLTEGVG